MGNYLACGAPVRVLCASSMEKPSAALARLVHTDGTIEDITPPVTVAELMLEHPLHFVCHVKSFESDSNKCSSSSSSCDVDADRPLPADYELESGEIYYLRSKAGFNSKSPLRQLRRSVSESYDKHRYSIQQQQQQQKKGSSSSLFQAFRMKQKGAITQVTVSTDFVAKLLSKHFAQEKQHVQQNVDSSGRPSSDQSGAAVRSSVLEDNDNPELQMAYQMRLISRSVSWRPKLATIDESSFN